MISSSLPVLFHFGAESHHEDLERFIRHSRRVATTSKYNLVLPTIELRGVFDLVPEPSTAALTALGLVGLAWRRRRLHS